MLLLLGAYLLFYLFSMFRANRFGSGRGAAWRTSSYDPFGVGGPFIGGRMRGGRFGGGGFGGGGFSGGGGSFGGGGASAGW